MRRVRVYELARELGMEDSKPLMRILRDMGYRVRTASSGLSPEAVRTIREVVAPHIEQAKRDAAKSQKPLHNSNLGKVPSSEDSSASDESGPVVLKSPDSTEDTPAEPIAFGFSIGQLPQASREIISIKPQQTLREAMTIMTTRGVSHLPILRSTRDVKGMLSWKGIGKSLLLSNSGSLDEVIETASVDAKILPATTPYLEAVPEILKFGAVLIQAKDKTLSGIVTKKDLGQHLNVQARPFVTLGEIERGLRILINRGRFTAEELRDLALDPESPRKVESGKNLSLGELQHLLEQDSAWERIPTGIAKKTFISHLNEVRTIRNKVMHFDPEPISEEAEKTLKRFLDLVHGFSRHST